ncbi:hypothetical protein K8I61_09235, partial [bacterium]|nr:hypothetical protein [bacterium]
PTAFFTWGDANDTFRRVRRTGKTWTSEPYYSPADDGQVTKAKYCSNTYAAATMMSDDQSSMNWLYTNGTDAITSRIYDGLISGVHDAYALGPDDSLHAVYYRSGPSPAFIYLTNTGGQWREEIIAEGENVGYYPDIAIDSLNRPHVVFSDYTNYLAFYALRNNGGNWSINIVPNYFRRVRVLSDDTPIALYSNDSDMLHVARKNGTAWEEDAIFPGRIDGSDMINGPADDIHIIYRRDKSFYYATKYNALWIEVYVLDVGTTSGDASATLDSLGNVHAAIYDPAGANGFIYYATNRSGAWDVVSLKPTLGISNAGHIVSDADDNVFIYTSGTDQVTYDHCSERVTSSDGINWEREWLDCAAAGVSDAFIAFDGDHIIVGASSGLILYNLPGL